LLFTDIDAFEDKTKQKRQLRQNGKTSTAIYRFYKSHLSRKKQDLVHTQGASVPIRLLQLQKTKLKSL